MTNPFRWTGPGEHATEAKVIYASWVALLLLGAVGFYIGTRL